MGLWDQRGGLLARMFPPAVKGEVIEPETKAMTGRGAYVLEYHEPLNSMYRRSGPRWMKRAQEISRTNPWIDRAERTITGRGASVPFHLEDEDEETVDDESRPEFQEIRNLLELPNRDWTRRQLWGITLRHMGVCNHAFWYLDQRDAVAGRPLAIYYLNPARMTPGRDANGNLTHWVLDADSDYSALGYGNGLRLELDEVLHFELEPSDNPGDLSGGLVEAAELKALLSIASDKFATHTLNSGGRRGHFIGPTEGRMPDEVYDALVAGLRNVADSPDAAKRNIVSKGPLNVQPQASTPRELEATGIMGLSRDDLLALWNCPPSRIGVPTPVGLSNGGDSKDADEEALWKGAVGPRLDAFLETLQYRLLDRWKDAGIVVQIVDDRPKFEDREPAFDLFVKSLDAPLRNKERRELLGYDPTGNDEFDNAIWMGSRLTEVIAIDDAGKVISEPEPEPPLLPPGQMPEMAEDGMPAMPPAAGKAVVRAPFGRLRQATERQTPSLARSVAAALREVKADVLKRLREKAGHLLGQPEDVTAWWQGRKVDAAFTRAIRPKVEAVAVEVTSAAKDVLDTPKKADADYADRVLDYVWKRGGERITGMVETTRDAVLDAIRPVLADAAAAGLGPAEVADRLTDAVGGLAVWDEARAETIARTETMLAYNDAALGSFREFGVDRVEAIDGDEDEECAARNGQVYPLEEALGITDHPNGTLDWLPVL